MLGVGNEACGGGSVLAFLVLHVFGLGAVLIVSAVLGMWDLVIVNSLVFLVLVRLEMVLCAKRYTVPMPVYADGSIGNAPAEESVNKMPSAEPQPTEGLLSESAITPEFVVAA